MPKNRPRIIKSQNVERTPYNITAILQLVLIIFDFIMDVLFASQKAREVEQLYIPNTIILTLTLTINFILALYIIKNEKSSNPEFTKWLNTHMKVMSIFTLLASADIETLNVLQSFDFFKAEFSDHVTKKIFWGACLDIIIEDIPQVTIQILYFRTVIYYDAISLLSLASSCLTLTVHIIGRLYQAMSTKTVYDLTDGSIEKPKQKTPHPLQFKPDDDREGGGGKGNVPEVVVDSQEEAFDQTKYKRSSTSSFQEKI